MLSSVAICVKLICFLIDIKLVGKASYNVFVEYKILAYLFKYHNTKITCIQRDHNMVESEKVKQIQGKVKCI